MLVPSRSRRTPAPQVDSESRIIRGPEKGTLIDKTTPHASMVENVDGALCLDAARTISPGEPYATPSRALLQVWGGGVERRSVRCLCFTGLQVWLWCAEGSNSARDGAI